LRCWSVEKCSSVWAGCAAAGTGRAGAGRDPDSSCACLLLTPEQPLITLYARISGEADHDEVLGRILRVLEDTFSIHHATIQVERGETELQRHERTVSQD
jgi:hypothetical protein